MVCTNLLCLPPELVDHIYFVIMLVATILNCLLALASIYRVIRRQSFCKPHGDDESLPNELPAVSIVVPCYLPNEQTIIESTIEHIMTKVMWSAPLTLHIVYNTPSELPFEQKLRDLQAQACPEGRKLHVHKVAGSCSKADNLNYIIPSIEDEYVVLYDADHHPEANSLQILASRLLRSDCIAMQGSTYIRNTRGSCLARYVDAEFFVTHFIFFPAMEILGDTGYFGGSNAMWRTDVLKKYPFDHKALTEDVDVSARALLDGHRIGFWPKARSGELAPLGYRALVSQRLRWFMGWEQVTHKYYWKVCPSTLSMRRKTGFCYLFLFRWFLLFSALLAAVINPVITSPFVYPLYSWSFEVQMCAFGSLAFYLTTMVLSLHHSNVYEFKHRQPMALVAIVGFFLSGALYVISHFSLQTIAFAKVFLGREGEWEVTARLTSGASPEVTIQGNVAPNNLSEPLLGANQERSDSVPQAATGAATDANENVKHVSNV